MVRFRDKENREQDKLSETLRTANSIVEFYEEVLAFHSQKINSLESENAALRSQLVQSTDLLRTILGTSRGGLIN